MKRFVKVVCITLCLIFIYSTAVYAGSAFSFTEEERAQTAADWAAIQADDTVITLSVGENPGDVGFSWLSALTDGSPQFRISENASMENAAAYDVRTTLTLYLRFSNKVTVKGLATGKRYWYSYTENGVWSEPAQFTLQDPDAYTFLFTSDAQLGRSGDAYDPDVLINDTCGWQRTVRLAARRFPETAFIVSAGDQTEYGFSRKQYKAFLSPPELRRYPMVNVIGNHDFYFPAYTYYSDNPNPVRETFAMPAGTGYYFRYGSALYIVLDSNDFYAGDQEKLLRAATDAYPDTAWRIVILHHSVYSANIADDSFSFSRSVFAPLFDAYDIDLALSGHEHLYNCTYPIYHGELNETGTVYLQAASASGSNFSAPKDSAVKYSRFVLREQVATYTAIHVDGEAISVETYRTDTDTCADAFTLQKRTHAASTPAERLAALAVAYIKTFLSMI